MVLPGVPRPEIAGKLAEGMADLTNGDLQHASRDSGSASAEQRRRLTLLATARRRRRRARSSTIGDIIHHGTHPERLGSS
jgi:hypothetical protein